MGNALQSTIEQRTTHDVEVARQRVHDTDQMAGIFIVGGLRQRIVQNLVETGTNQLLTDEGRSAGLGAANYIKGLKHSSSRIEVKPLDGVSYVVPQHIHSDVNEDVTLKFRVRTPLKNAVIEISSGETVLMKINKLAVIPSEMNLIKVNKDKIALAKDTITVKVYQR